MTDPTPSAAPAPVAEASPAASQRRTLTIVSLAEATSYVVLLVLSVWHHGFDGPDLAPITGPVHGFLFLAYVAMVLVVQRTARWSVLHTLVLLAASIVPLGCFFVAKRIEEDAVPAPA